LDQLERCTARGSRAVPAAAIPPLLLICLPGTAMVASGERSEHEYHNDPFTYLLFSFVMTFGLAAILMGAFAFKYGKKRTRMFSVPMMLSGAVIWGIWLYFNFIARADYPDDTFLDIIHWVAAPLLKPLMALVGFAAGVSLSLVIFLNTIVRA